MAETKNLCLADRQSLPYPCFMDRAGAFLELKIDIDDPVGVRDFAEILHSMAEQYDDFVLSTYGKQETDARFYITKIGQGCIYVHIAAATIGMMDQVIILKQFFEITKMYVSGLIGAKPIPDTRTALQADRISTMVNAVANADADASLHLSFNETKTEKPEETITQTSLEITKHEARQIVENARILKEVILPPAIPVLVDTAEKRVTMRLFQHNQDPNVGTKERTQHKAIVLSIHDKPKTLVYGSVEVADELADIVSGRDYAQIVFDVSVSQVFDGASFKAYRLEKIHNWFVDEQEGD